MPEWIQDLQFDFYQSFIEDNRWKYIVRGLGITLEVAFFALLLGVTLGVLVAVIRSTHDQQGKRIHGFPGFILSVLNFICKIYTTVVRGTPVMVQLLIMYFVIMVSSTNQVLSAVLAFGINSGAYVSEIVRSGIMSIDQGQMEAGRSLGLGYVKTMRFIVIPQAFKNVFPALGNELITLLKETSIVTVIGLGDLTKGALIIQGRTFQALFPLLTVAAIYLIMVVILSWLLGKMERRLRVSDQR